MIAACLALASSHVSPPLARLSVSYEPFRGLQVSLGNVSIITGSSFQYYEKKWARGIFSSNWRPVTINELRDGTIRVVFQGDNGQVTGTHDFKQTATGLTAYYEFRWRGDKPVMLESCFAYLWAPAVADGRAVISGTENPDFRRPPAAAVSRTARMLGPQGRRFEFDAPLATVTAELDHGSAIVFDARNFNQDWAKDRDLIWVGSQEREIKPQETIRYRVDWTITPKETRAPASTEIQNVRTDLPTALDAESAPFPLIPKPRSLTMGAGSLRLGKLDFEGEAAQQFNKVVHDRWRWDEEGDPVACRVNSRDMSLPIEGYSLSVTGAGIQINARDDQGVRNAFHTLANLVRPENRGLILPYVTIIDSPTLTWRGVHMFVGPQALAFQTELMEKVLAPLKFNQVVLQCERTDWKSTPGIRTARTMSRDDLAELFKRYRAQGVEPTPLVQSFGHVGWLFENRQNLDIALNASVPFTVDPRKSRTRELYTSLWTEIVELLRPKVVHFGLDEIDNRGLPTDPYFTTRLWKQHVPFLLGLADKLGVKPMMWGDIMIAPSEALDAAHAKTVAEAQERRQAIGRGVMIADWHYKDEPNPSAYTSLSLFKNAGHFPIAASWNKLGNIRGSALAAAAVNGGLLQTTWAGYESNQDAMIKQFDQFAAYIVAADYAWSGRTESPTALGYDPSEVLRRLFFSPPSAVRPVSGVAVVPGDAGSPTLTQIGKLSFLKFRPLPLHSLVAAEARRSPDELQFRVPGKGTELVLALDCLVRIPEAEAVAVVEIELANGKRVAETLHYGAHVRATHDAKPSLIAAWQGGLSAVRIPLDQEGDAVEVRKVIIKIASPTAGLRIHGITLLK